MGGDHTGPVDGKFDKAFFYGRGSNADGYFPFSGNRQLGKLTGLVGELVFVAVVEEDEFECLQALILGLDSDVIDTDRIG
jgi:hypothetical protein